MHAGHQLAAPWFGNESAVRKVTLALALTLTNEWRHLAPAAPAAAAASTAQRCSGALAHRPAARTPPKAALTRPQRWPTRAPSISAAGRPAPPRTRACVQGARSVRGGHRVHLQVSTKPADPTRAWCTSRVYYSACRGRDAGTGGADNEESRNARHENLTAAGRRRVTPPLLASCPPLLSGGHPA